MLAACARSSFSDLFTTRVQPRPSRKTAVLRPSPYIDAVTRLASRWTCGWKNRRSS